jgi:hypothetical protein
MSLNNIIKTHSTLLVQSHSKQQVPRLSMQRHRDDTEKTNEKTKRDENTLTSAGAIT